MVDALDRVPRYGARNLYEAIQSFILLWQVMCLEQAPNPYALSVGNADRIFEPYRAMTNMSREEATELLCCLLVFFNVGDRSWAISQNLLVAQEMHGYMLIPYVKFRGLKRGSMYREQATGKIYPADALMDMGLPVLPSREEYAAVQLYFQIVLEE